MHQAVTPSRPPRIAENFWLDHLPLDVCSRIARLLHVGFEYTSALNLSRTSEVQRSAVKDGFSLRLNFYRLQLVVRLQDLGDDIIAAFVAMMQNDVREIIASGSAISEQYTWPCFKSPALANLYLYDNPYDLDAIAYATNVRSLTLEFETLEHIKSLLSRLSILDLRELTLFTNERACLHKEFSDQPQDHTLLSTWFPRVERLFLFCGFCSGHGPRSFLWHIIKHFPVLQEVTVSESVPNDALGKLRQMDRVHLTSGGVFQLLEKISDHVVSVDTYDAKENGSYYSKETLQSLFRIMSRCKRLEDFRSQITRGTEHLLVDCVSNLTNLRVLNLTIRSDSYLENSFRADGMFLELAKAAPCLAEFEIYGARIRYGEIGGILMVLGKQLELYRDCRVDDDGNIITTWQSFKLSEEDIRSEFDAYIDALRTATLNCPSLRYFDIHVNARWLTDRHAISALLPKLEATLRTLQRRLPVLRVTHFRQVVTDMRYLCDQQIGSPEVEEHPSSPSQLAS